MVVHVASLCGDHIAAPATGATLPQTYAAQSDNRVVVFGLRNPADRVDEQEWLKWTRNLSAPRSPADIS